MRDVRRFLKAQDTPYLGYYQALEEMKFGRKISHWIWFVFPQMKGLGHSSMSEYYGIADREEAEDYLRNSTLNDRIHEISRTLLQRAFIATPHIAGYSLEGKLRATQMAFAALRSHFGIGIEVPEVLLPPAPEPKVPYNPLDDTRRLRQNPELFESMRSNYKLRRE